MQGAESIMGLSHLKVTDVLPILDATGKKFESLDISVSPVHSCQAPLGVCLSYDNDRWCELKILRTRATADNTCSISARLPADFSDQYEGLAFVKAVVGSEHLSQSTPPAPFLVSSAFPKAVEEVSGRLRRRNSSTDADLIRRVGMNTSQMLELIADVLHPTTADGMSNISQCAVMMRAAAALGWYHLVEASEAVVEENGYMSTVYKLADKDKDDIGLLGLAAASGSPDSTWLMHSILQDACLDCDFTSRRGPHDMSPLHCAALNGNIAILTTIEDDMGIDIFWAMNNLVGGPDLKTPMEMLNCQNASSRPRVSERVQEPSQDDDAMSCSASDHTQLHFGDEVEQAIMKTCHDPFESFPSATYQQQGPAARASEWFWTSVSQVTGLLF